MDKFKIILFIASLMFIYSGCTKIFTRSNPMTSTLADAEKKDLSKFDYFQLSGAYVSGIGYFEHDLGSTGVNEFVYGVISQKLIDEYLEKYGQTHAETDSFADWFYENVKPKIFVKSSKKNISRKELDDFLSDNDKEVKVSGTRIKSFTDLSDKIKDEMSKDGITENNTVIIQEGVKPSDHYLEGWSMLVGGILALFVSLYLFAKK